MKTQISASYPFDDENVKCTRIVLHHDLREGIWIERNENVVYPFRM